MDFVAVRPCRFDAFEAVPKSNVDLDLDDCERKLRAVGYTIVSNSGVMLVVKKGAEVTVYRHGRLLVHPASGKEDAEAVARELYSSLGL